MTSLREDPQSQLPAIELLVNLGWEYLTPEEAKTMLGTRQRGLIFEQLLRSQLASINTFQTPSGSHLSPSDSAIESGIDALCSMDDDGLIQTNQKIFDLLILGKSVKQVAEGQNIHPQLNFIDWAEPQNNIYHVTEEFVVERENLNEPTKHRIPDLVLFVNGIPLCVIECKAPDIGYAEGISQMIRNQKTGEIPRLFWFSQLLLSVDHDGGRYATTGTPAEFWAEWRERFDNYALQEIINHPLPDHVATKIESVPNKIRRHESIVTREQYGRQVTGQDRLIYALCRPERLLDLFHRFIVFDAGVKKIARYQQYFATHKILSQVKRFEPTGNREGGVIWHTQGSGKSLTMVMLARCLALDPDITNPRLVLVTDRVDLDKQIRDTFDACGLLPKTGRSEKSGRATSGTDLLNKLTRKEPIITTLIDKFEGALKDSKLLDDDPNLFVLVDESHRGQHGKKYAGQFGVMHSQMRRALPKACYIGFTGTPLMKEEKSTAKIFGGIIDSYTIDQAVEDQAVLRLLYEGRLIEQDVDQKKIDQWFERITRNCSKEQKGALKKRSATSTHLHQAEERMLMVAHDISDHFEKRFKGTGLKGQLVADSRLSAIKYKRLLDEIGTVTSEVIISKSDDREDHTVVSKKSETEIQEFWEEMMREHGSEEAYNNNIITRFKGDGAPDIIIVCSKLLTGFDAPRNTVLYLDRTLKEHTLLQAIARVNRKFAGEDSQGRKSSKQHGYIIDYRGILGELDKALATYSSLENFEQDEIETALFDVGAELEKLSDQHASLWSLFQQVNNKQDLEEYKEILRDEPTRDEFVERLRTFAQTLEIALSNMRWMEETAPEEITTLSGDLRFFENLRRYIRQLYSEEIDYKSYEAQMQKLIDRHVGSDEVRQLTKLVDIFDSEFEAEVERIEGNASRADAIASRTKKTIQERMDEDPAFYKRLSYLLRQIIDEYRSARMKAAADFLEREKADAEYLQRVKDLKSEVLSHGLESVPSSLREHSSSLAFYHTLMSELPERLTDNKDAMAELALQIDDTVKNHVVVDWQNRPDAQNDIKNAVEDALFESGLDIELDTLDCILDLILQAARHHHAK